MIKVVTAREIARVEGTGDAEKYMVESGRRIAESVIAFIADEDLESKVTLLVGTGNNGGDAYVAGLFLIEQRIEVQAIEVSKEGSPLNSKFKDRFHKAGGKVAKKLEGVILDGLFGTSFQGEVDSKIGKIIREANDSGLPILAIDIPSGLNGTTGEIGGVAIIATETLTLGLPKIGCFIGEGWNHTGVLRILDFGLPNETIAKVKEVAFLPEWLELPKIKRKRHKYDAGLVVGFAGSAAMSGAAKLSGLAALRGGAGIVKLFSPENIGPAPLELLCSEWDEKAWLEALKKAKAVFVGPGLGPQKEWLKKHLPKLKVPCVIDADALMPGIAFPKGAVLTPHVGEALRLLGCKEDTLHKSIEKFCKEKKVVVVLKGAPTFIFAPAEKPIIVPRGDPGMATAGAGDVLTGLIAALLAQGMESFEAAVLGVALHAVAGEEAALQKTSYCMIASDLIDAMSVAFCEVGHFPICDIS